MNATQEFMDHTYWLERYGWFGAMEDMQGVNEVCLRAGGASNFLLTGRSQADALMTSQGSINSLGKQYIGATIPAVSPNYVPGVVHGGSGSNSGSAQVFLQDSSVVLSIVLASTFISMFLH